MEEPKIEIGCTRCNKPFILENNSYHVMIGRYIGRVGKCQLEALEGPFGYKASGGAINWLCPQCQIELIENFIPYYDYMIPILKEQINV